jgi:uncharacterized protein YkwD
MPPGPRFGYLTLAAALAAWPLEARAGDGHLTPPGSGARSYFAPAPPGLGEEMLTDGLARGIWQAVRDGTREARRPLEPDARLHAFAEQLAATLGPDEVPGLETQEFLLAHHGLGEPVPELFMLQMQQEDDFIRDRVVESVLRALPGAHFARIGIGVHRRWFRRCVVVALQRVEVEMLPVPRRLPAGGSALLGGRLRRGLHAPTVLVAPPAGQVRELSVRESGGGSFQGSFRCDSGPGRYQVEVMARGRGGKTVVANFPLYCEVAPPTSGPRVAISGPECHDPRRAETLLLEAVNRDRARAGLSPVTWDEPLARVARDYSDEMSGREQVEHQSPTSGNAADRVRRSGARAAVVLENVARASSVADAQRSFMSSPGHRANVLDRTVTRMGAGVVIRRERGGVPSLYVTQLFAP